MSRQITRANEPEVLGLELIPEFHPHLQEARIAFLFTDIEIRQRGRVTLAKATKLTGVAHYLSAREDFAPVDFAIVFSEPAWDTLPPAQRRALVDHELCHLGRTEGEWAIMPHDVEEFTAIVTRHGAWQQELEDFAGAVAQLPLFAEK